MSLRVWLPLNGDLRNQGISGEVITSIGTNNEWTSNGKIGNSCLHLLKASGTIAIPSMIGAKQMSFAYWVKVNNAWSENWRDGIRWYSTDGSSDQYSRQEFYTNCTKVGVWFSGSPNSISGKNFTVGDWHHLAFTIDYNIGQSNFYIDGNLVGYTTGVNTTHYIKTGNFTIGDNDGAGVDISINDVRIYDHVLSAAEVKEIAQGLVLHYKLDQNITVGENIVPNSLNMGLGSANSSTGTWRTAGSNSMTRSRVAIYDTPEGNGYGFQNSGIQTYNDGSCYGIDSFPMEANTDYIISMWARITSGTEGYAGFNVYSCTVTGGSWTQKMKNYYVTQLPANGAWTKCWMSYKTNAATTRNIYIGITTGDTDVTTQMCNVHIEKGIINNNNTIKDSSGYNHNGVCVDTTISTDNPRYNTCISCIGTATDSLSNTITGAQYFYCNMDMPAMNAITIAWWNKIIKYGRGGIFETSNSIQTNTTKGADHSTTAFANWDNAFGVYNGSTRINIFSNFAHDGEWHYHAITFDGTNVKYYLDSILKQTSALTGNLPAWKSFCIGLGKAGGVWRQIQQNVSDFRIYCTALSADDIKQLYNTPMKIDDHKNIHTFVFTENDKNKLQKYGSLDCAQIHQWPLTNFLHCDHAIYTEPDGSKWVHIFHHNNPAASKFATTDTFTTYVYKSEDQWFDVAVCDHAPQWELMVKQLSKTNLHQKYRWVQSVNPMTATYAQVAANLITRNTSDEYTQFSIGGLYKKNSSVYISSNTGSSGSWWGGIGCFNNTYQGGIPGFGGNSNTDNVVTTGYIDLYLRIDNLDLPVKNFDTFDWYADGYIER